MCGLTRRNESAGDRSSSGEIARRMMRMIDSDDVTAEQSRACRSQPKGARHPNRDEQSAAPSIRSAFWQRLAGERFSSLQGRSLLRDPSYSEILLFHSLFSSAGSVILAAVAKAGAIRTDDPCFYVCASGSDLGCLNANEDVPVGRIAVRHPSAVQLVVQSRDDRSGGGVSTGSWDRCQ